LPFALHHGHITKSPIIAARRLSKADLVTRHGCIEAGRDERRIRSRKTMIVNGGTPLEAFRDWGRDRWFRWRPKRSKPIFPKYWDTQNKIVKSATSELVWDYGRQLITVQTPKTQAIIWPSG
jgi:hypothetical protein